MADSTSLGGLVAGGAGKPDTGHDDPMPTDPKELIAQIQDRLDALQAALGTEEQGEGEGPATGMDTGAEVPEPIPTDEEIVTGLKKPKPMSFGFGGVGRGR